MERLAQSAQTVVGQDPVHLRTKGHGALDGDLEPRLDPNAVPFGMAEKADVNADGHARLEDVITIGAEERRLRLVKTDGMGKRTDEVL